MKKQIAVSILEFFWDAIKHFFLNIIASLAFLFIMGPLGFRESLIDYEKGLMEANLTPELKEQLDNRLELESWVWFFITLFNVIVWAVSIVLFLKLAA
mgnify:CR=1 FL=1